MQLLISLCISLQFYLQFLQFLFSLTRSRVQRGWGHGGVLSLRDSLKTFYMWHIWFYIARLHFSFALHANLSRTRREEEGKKCD